MTRKANLNSSRFSMREGEVPIRPRAARVSKAGGPNSSLEGLPFARTLHLYEQFMDALFSVLFVS